MPGTCICPCFLAKSVFVTAALFSRTRPKDHEDTCVRYPGPAYKLILTFCFLLLTCFVLNEKMLRSAFSLFSSKTVTGTVKSFVPARGFGFVTLPDGREVFVHNSEIKSTGFRMLVPETTVKFEIVEKDGKFRASQVRNLDDSPLTPPPAPKSSPAKAK